MSQEPLNTAPVFQALTRQPMLLGVAYEYVWLSGLLVIASFVISKNLMALLAFFPLHLVGVILCKIDPCIFKLISVRAAIGTVKNKGFWKAQSYDPV
ncbi:MAG: VirB3 family type IV secretion system protein [Gammaproteobacteria bacterium]|nr:VirB3 family type IV secretion system protein [Gammaproteobacteria bacterium]